MNLHELLAQKVAAWRGQGYRHDTYPTIAEILEWASNPEGSGFLLRPPQIRALETYWYLRLVERTPHIFDLYRSCYPRTVDLHKALGAPDAAFQEVNYDPDELWHKIREDDSFVRTFKLETLRETLALRYSSYILALAMGLTRAQLQVCR